MIRFPCPACGCALKADDSWAGKVAPCPRCHTRSTIPGAPDQASLPAIVPSPAPERSDDLVVYAAQATRDATVDAAKATVPISIAAAKATGKGLSLVARGTVATTRFIATLVPKKAEPPDVPRAIPQAQPAVPPPVPGQPINVIIQNSPHMAMTTNVQQNNMADWALSNGMATVALLLAVAALIAAFVPTRAGWAFPLALGAMGFAGLGLLVSLFRRLVGMGSSILALILAVIAIPVAAANLAMKYETPDTAAPEVEQAAAQATLEAASSQPETVEPQSADAAPTDETVPATESIKPALPEWHPARTPLQLGAARITVLDARIGKVPLDRTIGGESESIERFLAIRLQIENTSQTRKMDLRGFNRDFSSFDDVAQLTDNFDNFYRRTGFGYSSKPRGQIDLESLYPGKSIEDVLVFEPPIEGFEFLRLELPAENVGEKGKFKFQIAREQVRANP